MSHRHQQPKTYTGVLKQPLAYEARPYFALFVGAIGIYDARLHHSTMSLVLGMTLITCGTLLLRWRMEHRRR